MRFVVLTFCVLIPLATVCQEEIRQEYRVDIGNDVFFGGLENVWFKPNTSAYGIEGTRFVFDDFIPANVYFSNKTMSRDKPLNYDCYLDQVVYSGDEGMLVLDMFKIDYIEFLPGKDSSIFFKKTILPDGRDVVFVRILYEGKSSLYKRYVKKLVVKDEQPTYNWGEKYANEYIIRESYYLRLGEKDKLVLMPPNKKSLLKLMSPFEQSIKSYMKNEKIRLKNETDLIKLIDYYDELTGNAVIVRA